MFGRSSELNETHMKPKLTGCQSSLNGATFGAEESKKYISKGGKCHFLCSNLKMENSMSGHTFCSFRTTDLNPTTDLIHLDLSEHTGRFSSTRAKLDPARPNGSFPPGDCKKHHDVKEQES